MRITHRNKNLATRRSLTKPISEQIQPELPNSSEDAVGYARVSDRKSAAGEISIPDQVKRINSFSESKNFNMIDMYIDRGKTATNDRRKEFQKMISDIESGRICPKYVIAYDQSRLFRNGVDLSKYEGRLAKFGVRFLTTTQNFGRSVSGVMSKKFIAGVDEYIPMITSVRVKEAQLALARQGFFPGGRTCYGIETYVVERYGKKVRRKLRPKSGEREVVEKIFQLSLHGDEEVGPCGIVKIAEWLDLNEIRTRGGGKFGAESIHLILTNSSYTGKYTWNYEAIEREFVEGDEDKEVFEFDLEPIIDKETFERVQLKMASQAPNKRTDTWVYRGSLLLRELAHCTCGGRLGLATGTGRE